MRQEERLFLTEEYQPNKLEITKEIESHLAIIINGHQTTA